MVDIHGGAGGRGEPRHAARRELALAPRVGLVAWRDEL